MKNRFIRANGVGLASGIVIKVTNLEALSSSETFRPRVNGVYKGTQGQNIIIDIEKEENLRLILANIYTPSGGTWQKERKSLFLQTRGDSEI